MTTYQIPPDTRAIGTGDPAGDEDNLADMDGLIASLLAQLLGAGTNADPGGNATNVAAILAARTAASLAPGASGSVLTSNGTGANPTFQQAFLVPTGVKTGAYGASAGDLVPCDTSGGGFPVTLPTAPAALTPLAIVLINGTNPVTIATGGSDVFDKAAGPTSITLYPGAGPGPSAILLQYRASGNIWYRQAGYNPSPLTTLGDVPYGGTGGAPTRLAGNSSATKNFLTQTGTGSASAAPAWGTIAAADLPAATTSLQGAVILDGTTGDIASLGTRAAGAVGKAADAGHVHPAGAAQWLPSDDGFLGGNSDPAYASGGGLTIDQTLYLQRITPRTASTVTNLWYCLSTIGSDTGTGSFFVGLWDSSGNLLSGSSNLVSSTTSGTGYKSFALTTPQSVTAGNIYYAGLLAHLTTTQPTFQRQNNSTNAAPQATTNIATARWSAKATFGTSLASATLSGFAQTAFTFIVLWT